MVRGRAWTGFEAAALQEAMRQSVREFAALLGVETTTVANWRSGLGRVSPRSHTQAILDTTYEQRATAEDRARFAQIVDDVGYAMRSSCKCTTLTLSQPSADWNSFRRNPRGSEVRPEAAFRPDRRDRDT